MSSADTEAGARLQIISIANIRLRILFVVLFFIGPPCRASPWQFMFSRFKAAEQSAAIEIYVLFPVVAMVAVAAAAAGSNIVKLIFCH